MPFRKKLLFRALTSLVAGPLCLLASAPVAAACTNDHFQLNSQLLNVQVCDAGRMLENDGIEQVRLQTHLAAGARALDHTSLLTVPQGSTSARVIDDINLAPLGLSGRLHITVALAARGPVIEHALTLPGPVILR